MELAVIGGLQGAGYAAPLLAGAAGYGVEKAYKYFNKKATSEHGKEWDKRMNANQIKKLANNAVSHVSGKHRGCSPTKIRRRKRYRRRKPRSKGYKRRKSKSIKKKKKKKSRR
jgi:hypothetical protein